MPPSTSAKPARRKLPQTRQIATILAFGAFFLVHFILQKSLTHSLFFTLLIAYLPFYFDRAEMNPENQYVSKSFAYHPFWTWFCRLWPCEVRVASEVAAVSEKQIVLSCHPHGVMTWQHFAQMTDGIKFLSSVIKHPRCDICASVLFRIPVLREILLMLGCVDASSPVCHRLLKAGYSMQLFCGGEREQLLANPAKHVVHVKSRKGFVKLAIQYKTPIVPCYTFNEDRMYTTSSFMLKARLKLAKLTRISIPIAWGRWFTIIPHKLPLIVCVGAPIEVEGKTIDQVHEEYMAALVALFDRHKVTVKGYENSVLRLD